MGTASGTAIDRLGHELNHAIDRVRVELDRIELLTVALNAFSQPVPDYEPGFQHLRHLTGNAIELKWSAAQD